MENIIQLYSLATPNGQKVSIALEEMGLPYKAHKIDITKDEQFEDDFIKINPNSKIPAIVDPTGDNGAPLPIMESGAILVYLADKAGKFLPKETAERNKVLQWLFWQVGGVGPMFGQFGHFHKYADKEHDLSYGQERYKKESKRLLEVLDTQLSHHKFVASDEISIADFAIYPWVRGLKVFYEARDMLGLDNFKNINRWLEDINERPSVQKGLTVCDFDA